MKKYNLVGKKFGRLTVIKYAHTYNKRRYWNCLCSCGNDSFVTTAKLMSSATKSCGCLRSEKSAIRCSNMSTTHGLSKTPFYFKWDSMKRRCLNVSNKNYDNYGGRGIKVSNKWITFENFRDDMYNSYLEHRKKNGSRDTSLDRIDNNGNYCKKNCRWSTMKEQGNNRRTNHIIEFDNEYINITQLSEKTGINRNTLYSRINRRK